MDRTNKLYKMKFRDIYPLYLNKVKRKSRSKEELDQIIFWMTGYAESEINEIIKSELTLEEFFQEAPSINKNLNLVGGNICGVKIEEIEDDFIKKIRQLDKLVDELAKGKDIEKIKR